MRGTRKVPLERPSLQMLDPCRVGYRNLHSLLSPLIRLTFSLLLSGFLFEKY